MNSCRNLFSLLVVFCFATISFSQTETATVSGRVTDQQGALLVGAGVVITNIDTNVSSRQTTNREGLYVVLNLKPGRYRITVSDAGFRTVNLTNVVLNVQDSLSQNFRLQVGSVSESVTVVADEAKVNTDSAAVSTVVDRNFAENLPMNGRSFQTLIDLTPGVVLTAVNGYDSGQFSINGQRASSNYWMLDGVSANIGISAGVNPGNGYGGTLGSFSALGGTNGLVSVDAMQEFRIQTSTFAPEFGRTPGGQISIVTRSGTNQFHGTIFEYLRNDAFDANNWFANDQTLPRPQERQSDFGGTLSGPILKERAFFFFSYEGLRLRLPQTTLSHVPDLSARRNATATRQPYLDAFPLPNGPDDSMTGIAQFNASYSNPASLNAYSLRIDHNLRNKWALFGRYSYSPSEFVSRGGGAAFDALSVLEPIRTIVQTATVGATWTASPVLTNDLRFNYSRATGESFYRMDNLGGAVPLVSFPFPSSLTPENSQFNLQIFSLGAGGILATGRNAKNIQRQFNIVDSVSWQKGSHSFRFGVDFRRLSPVYQPFQYEQVAAFNTVSDTQTGASSGFVASLNDTSALFRNLSAFVQDTWHALPRLTLTYGLRWDNDFAPSSRPSIPAVTGYNPADLSRLAFERQGTPPFKSTYRNIAPRLGIAYQLSKSQRFSTVLRAGAGLFYDLASAETGNMLSFFAPPFAAFNSFTGTFPYTQNQIAPVPIPSTGTFSSFDVFNPNLKLPYTVQWSLAIEQSLGADEKISASYVGAVGRRLLQSTFFFNPQTNPKVGQGAFVDNTAASDYNALQLQFQRKLSHRLQALASYAWSHSIDNASASSVGNTSNFGVPASHNGNRGNSDFDIRNTFSMGLTYDIPVRNINRVANAILQGWSTDSLILARSAQPVDVADINFFQFDGGILSNIRPDVVAGKALYIYGSQCTSVFQSLLVLSESQSCPGGKGLNPAAFTNPPINPATGNPLRQGNLARNVLRGFGATQWDFAVHRHFPIHENLKLEFRAEMFNLLNHPNFGSPNNAFGGAGFGLSTQTLAQSLSANGSLGSGSFSPLYQVGGPRSIQLALKMMF